MRHWPDRIWRTIADHPRLSVVLLGFVSATGFQPLGFWPLALLAMAGFVGLMSRTASVGAAAWLGWWFGLAHFTFGNNWIATAFTHQANMPAILGWAAVPLLATYLAIYPAMAAAGGRFVAGRGMSRPLVFAFAGCWGLSEIMRATVFTGYAWNPFAMILLGPFDRPGLAALSPYMGTYALSALAVVLAGAVALMAGAARWRSAALIGLLIAVGMYLPAPATRQGTVPFTLVQPNLPQELLHEPALQEANFEKLARLSLPRGDDQGRLVLWPESGMADYLQPGYPQRFYDQLTAFADPELARRRIGRVIGAQSLLLTGAVDLEIQEQQAIGAYNSVTAIGGDGAIRGGYSKTHLVPYGEYLPMRWLLEPLGFSRLVPGAIDFLPGAAPRTRDLARFGHAGIQICYEIIFSGDVTDRANRPDYIFNPSNDGWFGEFGPPQHLAQARMRAVEEGLPVLRSTTTGISAVIDANGVVKDHLDMHRAGRMDGMVPAAKAATPFALLGVWLSLAWIALLIGSACVARRHAG